MDEKQLDSFAQKGTIALVESKGMEVIRPNIKNLGSGIANIAARDGNCLVLVRIESRLDGTPPAPFSLNRARVYEVAALLEAEEALPAALSEVRLDLSNPRILANSKMLISYEHDCLGMQGERPRQNRKAGEKRERG